MPEGPDETARQVDPRTAELLHAAYAEAMRQSRFGTAAIRTCRQKVNHLLAQAGFPQLQTEE